MLELVDKTDLKSVAVKRPGSSPGAHTKQSYELNKMYEETEYFKRFAKCYLMWSHSNMDRIVIEIIKKDAEAEVKRKEKVRAKILMAGIHKYTPDNSFNFNFDRDVKWGIKQLQSYKYLKS